MNDKLRNFLVCKYENCNKYFQNPVMLSCGKSICKIHIDDLLSNDNLENKNFNCKMCKGQHLVEKEAFIVNNDLIELIEEGEHLYDEQLDIQDLYNYFEQIYNNLQKIVKDPGNYLHDYISDLKHEVDLQREVLKSKIDQIALDIISKIDELNEECKSDIKENKNVDISKFNYGLIEFKDYSRMPNIEEITLKKKYKELAALLDESKKMLDDLEKKLLKGKTCKFERSKKDFFYSDFGTFIYEEQIKLEELLALSGHDDVVTCIKYLENNKLASSSCDNTVKIWDLESGDCLSTLEGHSLEINILCILSNNRLASGSDDNTVKIWDLETYECLETMEEENSPIYSLIEAQGLLIAGLLNGYAIIWNAEHYIHINTIHAHFKRVTCLLELSDIHFASASEDHTIKIWDIEDFTVPLMICTLSHLGPVNDLKLMKNGNLISVSKDNSIKIWDSIEFDCIFSFMNDAPNFSVTISNDSDFIILGDYSDKLKILSTKFPNQCSKTIFAISFYDVIQIPNGSCALTSDNEIIIYKNGFDIFKNFN